MNGNVKEDLKTLREFIERGRVLSGANGAHEALDRLTSGFTYLSQIALERSAVDAAVFGGTPPSKVSAIEISPPLDGFECGRCWQLHAKPEERGEEIPEHSPRCPMLEERAAAWDAGYLSAKPKNPHR